MLHYFISRLVSLVLSLAFASLVIFFLIEIVPGDPASFMLGVNAQPDTVAALRAELGLDTSRTKRYLTWVGGMLTGDFGTSYTYRTTVSEMLADRMQVSLPLTLYALALFPPGYMRQRGAGAWQMRPSWAPPSLASPFQISGSR